MLLWIGKKLLDNKKENTMFNDKKLKIVSDAVLKIMEASMKEELKGNQHKIDANKNNKVDAHDFKLLRAGKKVAKEDVEQIDEISSELATKLQKGRAKQAISSITSGDNSKAGQQIASAKTAKKYAELRKAQPTGNVTKKLFSKEDVEQVEEGIEDKLEAARAKAKAAGKIMKGPAKAEKSNVTKVAGKAYGGSAQKDDDENDEDDEPKKASKKGVFKRRYNTKVYKEQFSHLLDSYINGGLKSVMEDLEVVEVDEEVEQIDEGKMNKMSLSGLWHKHAEHSYLADQGYGHGTVSMHHNATAATAIENHVRKHHGNKVADNMVSHSDHHVAVSEYAGPGEAEHHEKEMAKLRKQHGIKDDNHGVNEEVDNETFTKEVEAQKAKAAGKGKKADIAAASVQAVTKEEVDMDVLEEGILDLLNKARKSVYKTADEVQHDHISKNTHEVEKVLSSLKAVHSHLTVKGGSKAGSHIVDAHYYLKRHKQEPENVEHTKNLVNSIQAAHRDIARKKEISKNVRKTGPRVSTSGLSEDVEQIEEISKSTYVGAMQTLSDPDTDRGHHDTDDKLISRAKKQHGEKFAKDLQGVYKTHWPRANQADGRDKLKSSAAVRTTQSGKANKQDVKTKSKEIQSRLGTHKKSNLPEQFNVWRSNKGDK